MKVSNQEKMNKRLAGAERAQNTIICLALFILLGASAVLAQSTADESLLKPGVPRLDITPPTPPRTLKGGVQHREGMAATSDQSKKLSSGVFDLLKKKKKARLNAQTAKIEPDAMQRSGLDKNSNTLEATIPNGLGIIGVKFLLSFGHMPVINRVFPGTPAWSTGLHARDIIVAVDGVPTLGLSKEDVYGMIVGKPDTEVTISIRRGTEFIAKTMKRMDFNDIPDPLVRQDYLMSI